MNHLVLNFFLKYKIPSLFDNHLGTGFCSVAAVGLAVTVAVGISDSKEKEKIGESI